MFDLIIIGGGPAGSAASVYAARKRLKTLHVTKEFGGQSVVSLEIQNWIGTPALSGLDLAKALETHVITYADDCVSLKKGALVTTLTQHDGTYTIITDQNESFSARAILIATGADRRKLMVPGADVFEHKGVVYCASCDGPLFSGMDTVVIGGGNAGFETAAQLLAYTKSVTLLQHRNAFKADEITVEKVLQHPNMRAYTNAQITRVLGETMVTGIEYLDKDTGETKTLPASGVFVEIGMVPNTSFVEGVVDMDDIKRIKVNPKNQRTSVEGIWAAGDCTDELYHQNNIAAGDGVKALEDIYVFLKTR